MHGNVPVVQSAEQAFRAAHYGRNRFNTNIPNSIDAAREELGEEQAENRNLYHRNQSGNQGGRRSRKC